MRRRSAAALAVALSIGWSGFASAQEMGELAVTTAPVIVGNPVVGSTLRASGGAWTQSESGGEPDPGVVGVVALPDHGAPPRAAISGRSTRHTPRWPPIRPNTCSSGAA